MCVRERWWKFIIFMPRQQLADVKFFVVVFITEEEKKRMRDGDGGKKITCVCMYDEEVGIYHSYA